MPIEIRELVIKTEVAAGPRSQAGAIREKDLSLLKKQLLEECRRIINENTRKTIYKR